MSEQEIEAMVRRVVGKISFWKVLAGLAVGILTGGFAAGQFWAGKGARDDAQDAKITTIQQDMIELKGTVNKIYDFLISKHS